MTDVTDVTDATDPTGATDATGLADGRTAGSPRTALPPAGRLLWRSATAAQLEIGLQRVVLDGVGTDTVRSLLGRPAPEGAAAVPDSAEPPVALQRRLLDAGYLWAAGDPDDLRRQPPHPRLAAELTALSARAGDEAAELLSARRHAVVAVHGPGRVGPHVAAILGAAGVGRVHLLDASAVRLHHVVPGGATLADEGAPLSGAAAAAVRRHAPDVDCFAPRFGEPPDLVVLALEQPVDSEQRDALHARGCAHLLVHLGPGHGAVGPLVLPGLTSCLRCADLHRLDRDPAWNALAVQLTVPHRAAVASEVALATIVAGVAAVQALDFLDGGRPATVEGSIEMQLPDWRLRRRSWLVHPDCDCMPGRRPTGIDRE